MNSLKVPEAGLTLEGPSGQVAAIPPQAFALSLSGDVVANLIKAARGGDGIELALGKNPVRFLPCPLSKYILLGNTQLPVPKYHFIRAGGLSCPGNVLLTMHPTLDTSLRL